MEYYNHPPEFSLLPPEQELRPELELTAPPPEFGQGPTPPAEEEKPTRRLRHFLAVPAVVLVSFLCLHGVKAPISPSPGPTEAAPEPSAPVETATEPPALPQGSVILDVEYAVRSGGEVLYSYYVYSPIPSLDATQAQIDAYQGTPWPVSVYAQVSDGAGRACKPEQDPDVWEDSRYRIEYGIPCADLEGDLTLTLTAIYTEGGEERCSTWSGPVSDLPAMPLTNATLEAFPGGDVAFTATLLPDAEDDHVYDLYIDGIGQVVYEGDDSMGLSLTNELMGDPVEGDREQGYTVHYEGGSALTMIPEEAELAIRLILKDRTTGYLYTIESNRVSPAEAAEVTPTYPLEDGTIVLTVYNDTFDFDVPTLVPNDEYKTILAQTVIAEADFTDYALPDAIAPPAFFSFNGWVVDYGNAFDNGYEREGLYDEGEPSVDRLITEENFCFPLEGATLTREAVERIPVSDDGKRYVNVHATWKVDDPGVSSIRLNLDDGYGEVIHVSIEHPMMSEGTLYLCQYPVPEREGMVFEGWYDENGKRVQMLNAWYSFTATKVNPDGSFGGYTGEPIARTLTAHWKMILQISE
ncbi:MAG: hypothetical protein J5789_04975 [Oscillospiraceae bacterium]|nr:hypothetical protein [Oscillospiraceae bacterium]